MINHLAPIVLQKKREIADLKKRLEQQPEHPIVQLLQGKTIRTSNKSFAAALQCEELAIIAEIKRKSPSKGELAPILDPVAQALTYFNGGANALSILTDQLFFGGSTEDLHQVAFTTSLPILRKDFIIDEIQIAEAVTIGADAILCIVAITGNQTAKIIHCAEQMNLEVLVEVHTEHELEIALKSGAKIIGINNRDLNTFTIDTEQALRLAEGLPASCIKVAESGILKPELAKKYYQAGFHAVLIGEALVTSKDPQQFMRACRDG